MSYSSADKKKTREIKINRTKNKKKGEREVKSANKVSAGSFSSFEQPSHRVFPSTRNNPRAY